MIGKILSGPAPGTPEDDQNATCDYRDALTAVLEAVDIPHAATVGDQKTRDQILVERAGHTVVMLRSILCDEHPPDIPWSVAYLRARLAEHPAVGYKTWEQRMAELDAMKAGGR